MLHHIHAKVFDMLLIEKIGTHCIHVGSAERFRGSVKHYVHENFLSHDLCRCCGPVCLHMLWTCLFTDTHSYMPDDIVGRAL